MNFNCCFCENKLDNSWQITFYYKKNKTFSLTFCGIDDLSDCLKRLGYPPIEDVDDICYEINVLRDKKLKELGWDDYEY